MLCHLFSVDKKHRCWPLLRRTIIKLTPQLLQSPQFNQDPSTMKTNITLSYFHLFDFKRRPGHIASWQLWPCNFSPRQDWSRSSPIFSHCLFLVWVPGPQLELHIVHWDQADQAENEVWGKFFFFPSYPTRTRSFQALLHFNHLCFRAGRASVSGSCTSPTSGPGYIDVDCGYKPGERLMEDKRGLWWYTGCFLTVPPNFQYQNEKQWVANQRFCSMNSRCT